MMVPRLLNIPMKVVSRIGQRGWLDTFRWGRAHVDTVLREKRRRIDTGGRIGPTENPVNDCHGYEPISYECLDRIFESIQVNESDVLVDYGSGKGRVLLEALQYPFKRVIGVEFDQRLIQFCESNVQQFSLESARRIQLIHADAREYAIPDDVNWIFVWNSFVGDVMKSVIERVEDHFRNSASTCHLVIALPTGETESLKFVNRLELVKRIETRFWTGIDLYHFSNG